MTILSHGLACTHLLKLQMQADLKCCVSLTNEAKCEPMTQTKTRLQIIQGDMVYLPTNVWLQVSEDPCKLSPASMALLDMIQPCL